MSRELNGAELAAFIKARQAKQVRNLKQEYHVEPRLAVVMSKQAAQVSEVYVRMKQRYGEDIGVAVNVVRIDEHDMPAYIRQANDDSNVHGIIVQLPLEEAGQTNTICDSIDSQKDVDGLGRRAAFAGATAEAIDWLLAGYNVELEGKAIAIVGYGKLVGQPLERLWKSRSYDVSVVDIDTPDPRSILRRSDVVVTATGVPRRLTADDVKPGAVVVDAGTAAEGGIVAGDADDGLRARSDITITPVRGGVGPLTVAVLFDHIIQAALQDALHT